jgi:kinetochore protein Nuf2
MTEDANHLQCGVQDFTLNDLYRPTRERLVRVFSHVINFLRFRESQAAVTDEHFNKSEKTKERIEVLLMENQAKEDQLNELERNRRSVEALIADKQKRYQALKDRLLELKDVQGRVTERLDKIREDQARLRSAMEEANAAKTAAEQDSQKLRPYSEQSPVALENSLKELNTALSTDRAQIDLLDRRARALQTSTDAFTTVTADVETCTTLLHDLQRDLAAEEATRQTATKSADALSDRTNTVRDMDRREKQLQKQLASALAKTDKVRGKAKERSEADAKKMEELKKLSDELRRERGESGREMERKRAKIEQTEKKMGEMREMVEAEVKSAQEEYVRLESHIQGYMREVGSLLVVE